MLTNRKRFITGATCPVCNVLDSLRLWCEDKIEIMECVRCGHHQRQVNKHVSQHVPADEQIIGIFYSDQ